MKRTIKRTRVSHPDCCSRGGIIHKKRAAAPIRALRERVEMLIWRRGGAALDDGPRPAFAAPAATAEWEAAAGGATRVVPEAELYDRYDDQR